jgi:hypothetical protein
MSQINRTYYWYFIAQPNIIIIFIIINTFPFFESSPTAEVNVQLNNEIVQLISKYFGESTLKLITVVQNGKS